jgi:glycosyltransferase involved in cell wall biosynthesis
MWNGQLIHLSKYFSGELDIFVEEIDLCNPEWSKLSVDYGEEYKKILASLKRWEGQAVDVVYRLGSPCKLSSILIGGKTVPQCIFYTSEFQGVVVNDWLIDGIRTRSVEELKIYLSSHPEIYFTTPSAWSAVCTKKFEISDSRCRVVPHGVDSSIFRQISNQAYRQQARRSLDIDESDVLLMNIGAMTPNKGIRTILEALHILVNKRGLVEFKLLLKGSGGMYQSEAFIVSLVATLIEDGQMSKEEMNLLQQKHIRFVDEILSFDRINGLLNAADLYISPYRGEGFNLPVRFDPNDHSSSVTIHPHSPSQRVVPPDAPRSAAALPGPRDDIYI